MLNLFRVCRLQVKTDNCPTIRISDFQPTCDRKDERAQVISRHNIAELVRFEAFRLRLLLGEAWY